MRMLRRLLVLAVFGALFVATWRFVSGNGAPIDLDLVLVELHQVPLWSALLGAFALGATSAGASLLYELAKKSFAARRYRKALAGLESEIHQLRNLPLAAPEASGGPAPPARSAAGPRS
jgi:Lipopolysaccharide assembly protein A domain